MSEGARLVVVGYGMGAHHAKLISQAEGLTLYGVCDLDPAKRARALAEHPDIRLYSTYDDALADPLADGMVIVTPHNVHATMAIAALDSGKHAITDKAMCLTVTEATEMIAARDRSGRLLSTFHNRRWDSEFLTVRKLIEDGVLGRLYHIESCVTEYGHPGGWRTNRAAMGGWLFDWGAHTLDQILILANAVPTSAYAFAHHRFGAESTPESVEDYVNCTVRFNSGVTATTVIGYINRIPMPRWYIIGEKGALVADNFDKPVRVKAAVGSQYAEVSVPLIKGDWLSFYQNIAAAIAGTAELAVKPEQLVPQIAIAQAAYRSIETGQAANVDIRGARPQ